MPSSEAEVYFIAAMMVLILVISAVSVYFFFKQYKKEMRDKADRASRKGAEKTANAKADTGREVDADAAREHIK